MSSVTIDSTSTLAQVKSAYYDTCTYDIDNDLGKAHTFLAACRQLLLRLSKRVGHGNKAEEVEIDPGVLERQIAECKRWIFVAGNQQNTPLTRVFTRGDQNAPTFPGPYWS